MKTDWLVKLGFAFVLLGSVLLTPSSELLNAQAIAGEGSRARAISSRPVSGQGLLVPWVLTLGDEYPVVHLDLEELYITPRRDFKILPPTQQFYLLNVSSSALAEFLQISWRSNELSESEVNKLLRQISGRVLYKLLIELGGDGTDHSSDDLQCESWISQQIPSRPVSYEIDFIDPHVWYANYSGLLVDLVGTCQEVLPIVSQYLSVRIAYDPILDEGQIFISAKALSNYWSNMYDRY